MRYAARVGEVDLGIARHPLTLPVPTEYNALPWRKLVPIENCHGVAVKVTRNDQLGLSSTRDLPLFQYRAAA